MHKITDSTSVSLVSTLSQQLHYNYSLFGRGKRELQLKVDFEKFFRAQGFIFNEPLL